VEFVDFECQYCRLTHERLAPILSEHSDRVRVVRKHVPLTGVHSHALVAARAACCGEVLGQGDRMADALFRAGVSELTPDGCARIATAIGIDPDGFGRCMRDSSVDRRIEADAQVFQQVGGRGLPTMWIGHHHLEGAQPESRLRGAVEEAFAELSS
jgi:predicted DsbA family dithiol-disulfide isomerase